MIYRLTVQTLPDGLETQFTPPDTTQTVLCVLTEPSVQADRFSRFVELAVVSRRHTYIQTTLRL